MCLLNLQVELQQVKARLQVKFQQVGTRLRARSAPPPGAHAQGTLFPKPAKVGTTVFVLDVTDQGSM